MAFDQLGKTPPPHPSWLLECWRKKITSSKWILYLKKMPFTSFTPLPTYSLKLYYTFEAFNVHI